MQPFTALTRDWPASDLSVPVRPKDRIQAIDVLRGLALFGVLMVNLVTEFRVSVFQQFLPPAVAVPSIDRITDTFVSTFLELKAISLFSLLFGMGLAIQFEHLGNSESRLRLLVRRLIVLLVFGLIHMCLIWNGDILTEYALIGLVALPFLYLPNRTLIAVALTLFAFFASLASLLPPSFWPTQAWMQQQVVDANHIYANGSYLDTLNFRLREIRIILPLLVYISPRTLALFLTGIVVWRSGIFRSPATHKHTLSCVAILGLFMGGCLTILDRAGPDFVSGGFLQFLSPLLPLGPVALAFGYASVLLLLIAFTRARHALGIFAPLGRMAFTNYILQSLTFSWIFYGYGLGYFGRLGTAQTFMLGMTVYAAQLIASAWWLRWYRFGPIEWLWRTMMYGVRQPMILSRD